MLAAVSPAPSYHPAAVATVAASTDAPTDNAEYDDLNEALEHYFGLLTESINTRETISLYCSLPSWSPESGYDIHDLHDLNTRLIVSIHKLVNRLRAVQVHATYHLCPCRNTSSAAIIRAVPPNQHHLTSKAEVEYNFSAEQRSKAFIAKIGGTPTLIVT